MDPISLIPIGVIHTPFQKLEGMPIQPPGGLGIRGHVDLYPEFQEGLKDLDGFSHIILLYYFHLAHDFSLSVKPFLDQQPRGVFATRAPNRPNSLGMSVVCLERIEKARLHIINVDVLDRTPLLDIKPYVPEFDSIERAQIGWLSERVDQVRFIKSDNRFS